MSHLKDQMLPSDSALQRSRQVLQEREVKSVLKGVWVVIWEVEEGKKGRRYRETVNT